MHGFNFNLLPGDYAFMHACMYLFVCLFICVVCLLIFLYVSYCVWQWTQRLGQINQIEMNKWRNFQIKKLDETI
jgi:hypothetical protein